MGKKDLFSCVFDGPAEKSDEYRVIDPNPEPATAAAAGAYAPHLSAKGLAYVAAHWDWKLKAECPKCHGRRFVSIFDAGGSGPNGEGWCAKCGEAQRKKERR